MKEADGRQHTADSRSSDEIDALLTELINVEGDVVGMLRRATYALMNAQEENRRLQREATRAELNWYTEAQLADRIGCSKDTLARLRRAKKIPCVQLAPTVIRYSSIQEAKIAEMLESGQLSILSGVGGRKTG